MDIATRDLLKEKLGDTKIKVNGEDKSLLDVVVDWEDGLIKTKATNANWVKDRESWEVTEKDLKKKIAEIDSVNKALSAQIKDASLSDEDKKRLKDAKAGNLIDKTEFEKQLNTVQEQLKNVTDALAKAQTEAQEAKANKRKADEQSAVDKLHSDYLSEAAKHKIVGAQAEAVWALIKEKGNAKIVDDAEKGFVPSITIFKDNRPFAADLTSLCKQLATDYQWAVSASGNKGTGQEHQTDAPGMNSTFTGKESLTALRNKWQEQL